jgi:FkbM family methyltransferase
VRIQPEAGDHVVDAGACFGDTAVDFAEAVGETGHVYSFDPLAAHQQIVRHNIQQNNLSNTTVFSHGLSDYDFEAPPVQDMCDPGFGEKDIMPVRRLDDLVAAGTIPRVDCIKMDIEGYELPALKGAEATLRTFRPKLAISLYHRWDDYFVIPDFIANLNLGYRFFLQNYTVGEGETVLYCIASPSGARSPEIEQPSQEPDPQPD